MNSYTLKNWMWVVIVGMFLSIFLLTGCSTVAGVGKDIQDSAQWTKEKMGGSK